VSSGTNNDVDVEKCGSSGINETDDVEYEWVNHSVAIHCPYMMLDYL
jgi:hypothetical protein